jgi:hypothetical protein
VRPLHFKLREPASADEQVRAHYPFPSDLPKDQQEDAPFSYRWGTWVISQ